MSRKTLWLASLTLTLLVGAGCSTNPVSGPDPSQSPTSATEKVEKKQPTFQPTEENITPPPAPETPTVTITPLPINPPPNPEPATTKPAPVVENKPAPQPVTAAAPAEKKPEPKPEPTPPAPVTPPAPAVKTFSVTAKQWEFQPAS